MPTPKRVRGGLTLGVSSALSLAIGLEMIIYLAILGAAAVLFWVDDPEERDRLRAYALSLGAGTALSFLILASYDNRAPVCDALSPVWLSDALLGGALMYGLALLSPGDWSERLGLAVIAGVAIAAFHALTWPHCIQRLEGVSPEVERLWLSYVKEARPIYRHGWRIAALVVALPITGLIGWGALAWVRRRDRDLLRRIIGGRRARSRRDLAPPVADANRPGVADADTVGARPSSGSSCRSPGTRSPVPFGSWALPYRRSSA